MERVAEYVRVRVPGVIGFVFIPLSMFPLSVKRVK
jgi:hypothetical protein